MRYLRENAAELGGSIPARRAVSYSLPAPAKSAYAAQLKEAVSAKFQQQWLSCASCRPW